MTTPTRRPLGKRLWIGIIAAAVISVTGPVVTGVGAGFAERKTVLRVPDVSGPITWTLRPLSAPAFALPDPPRPVPPPRIPRASADVARQAAPALPAQLTEVQGFLRPGEIFKLSDPSGRKSLYGLDTPGLTAPTVKQEVRPAYTLEAMRAGVQGTVLVRALIDSDGTVFAAEVLKGIDPGLDNAALIAAKRWLFEPGTLNGQPVNVIGDLPFSFRIF